MPLQPEVFRVLRSLGLFFHWELSYGDFKITADAIIQNTFFHPSIAEQYF